MVDLDTPEDFKYMKKQRVSFHKDDKLILLNYPNFQKPTNTFFSKPVKCFGLIIISVYVLWCFILCIHILVNIK